MGTSAILFPGLAGRRTLMEREDAGQFVGFSKGFFSFPRATQNRGQFNWLMQFLCKLHERLCSQLLRGHLSWVGWGGREVTKQTGRLPNVTRSDARPPHSPAPWRVKDASHLSLPLLPKFSSIISHCLREAIPLPASHTLEKMAAVLQGQWITPSRLPNLDGKKLGEIFVEGISCSR